MTFRTLAVAAIAVLLLAPEAVVHPSFQMSFAATLALVAGYRHGLPFARATADTSFSARIALWGVREVLSLIFASLLAGLATTPYAAFHFHRMAPYGVLANLLAMPVVSAWVMPIQMVVGGRGPSDLWPHCCGFEWTRRTYVDKIRRGAKPADLPMQNRQLSS
jgi:competence protein ComEC